VLKLANLDKLANHRHHPLSTKESFMRVMTATDVKNRLGEALSFPDDESLLIEKNGKGAFMAFSAFTGQRIVLSAYVQGALSRSSAMKLLGLAWYGDLLAALAQAGLPQPCASEADRTAMAEHATQVLAVGL
jgi:hypothetical protein